MEAGRISKARPRPLAKHGGGIAGSLESTGRRLALLGVVLPLLLIGGLKFTRFEIEALRPIIGRTPWLAWMYGAFGEAGASYLLGVVELLTAALLVASVWSARAAIGGGALASLTFVVTCSTMFTLPIWEPSLGFPALGPAGQFLIKDVALLGIALVVVGDGLSRVRTRAAREPIAGEVR